MLFRSHALANAAVPSIRVLDWVGTEIPAEPELRRLVETRPTRKELSRVILVSRHRANEVPGARVRPTGLVIPPRASLDLIDQFIGVRNWAELDSYLDRVLAAPPTKRRARRGRGRPPDEG